MSEINLNNIEETSNALIEAAQRIIALEAENAALKEQLSAAQARITELEKEASEPVAYLCPNGGGTVTAKIKDQWTGYERYTIPLYLRAPQAIPEGWKLVPIEPTEAMVDAVQNRYFPTNRTEHFSEYNRECKKEDYRVAIAAAPILNVKE